MLAPEIGDGLSSPPGLAGQPTCFIGQCASDAISPLLPPFRTQLLQALDKAVGDTRSHVWLSRLDGDVDHIGIGRTRYLRFANQLGRSVRHRHGHIVVEVGIAVQFQVPHHLFSQGL